MQDSLLIFITAAFLLAGFVKGVIGLGLPTVSMGLLAVTMAPGQVMGPNQLLGTDLFDLARQNGKWVIIHKSYWL